MLAQERLSLFPDNPAYLLKVFRLQTVNFTQISGDRLGSILLFNLDLNFMPPQVKLNNKLYLLFIFLSFQKFRRVYLLLSKFEVIFACWFVVPQLFLDPRLFDTHLHPVYRFMKPVDRTASFIATGRPVVDLRLKSALVHLCLHLPLVLHLFLSLSHLIAIVLV